MSNIDRPLRNIPYGDLNVLSNSLHDAIQDATFCGCLAMAEKLRETRKPIVDEMMQRPERRRVCRPSPALAAVDYAALEVRAEAHRATVRTPDGYWSEGEFFRNKKEQA
jgi:hypothetical protein